MYKTYTNVNIKFVGKKLIRPENVVVSSCMASTVINGTRTAISRRVVTHLPATVRALEDLRRLRRRDDTTCMEDAVKTIFKATEPKILTEYHRCLIQGIEALSSDTHRGSCLS